MGAYGRDGTVRLVPAGGLGFGFGGVGFGDGISLL